MESNISRISPWPIPIKKKFINFKKQANFDTALQEGSILSTSIVFIDDTQKIWTHGVYFSSLKEVLDMYSELRQVIMDMGTHVNEYIDDRIAAVTINKVTVNGQEQPIADNEVTITINPAYTLNFQDGVNTLQEANTLGEAYTINKLTTYNVSKLYFTDANNTKKEVDLANPNLVVQSGQLITWDVEKTADGLASITVYKK